jgi:uncharacterized protein (DUF2147 family)
MNRTSSWLGVLALATLSVGPVLAAGGSPIGQWEVTTGEARYVVTSCGSANLCAKLVWLRADARTQENLAVLNHYVVRGAKANGGGQWLGTLTMSGHSYDGTMTMVSKNFMTLRGCSGILCQTYEFTRI